MKMPYDGDFRVASEYGARHDPISGVSAFHGGIDLVSLGSKAIKCVEDSGIMQGDGRGNFRLGDNITREECAVMLYRMFGLINKGKEV